MTTPEDHTEQDFDLATLDAAIASMTPRSSRPNSASPTLSRSA
ncbi:hypothetical protein ACFQV2_12870 [Actinokineospora soli]|uniref:Uncharacterized protein n=1 Tax=Actinokineospora soli TaxID=1048753 RepID=A0ABW2TM22_9PSEU